MERNEVKEFYNEFLKSRMINYRLNSNPRLERAKVRILQEIKRTNKVLDIGCGIGIVTEQIANKASKGYVLGIDLSKENIWYSKKTINRKNLSFLECDIIEEFDKLNDNINGFMDIITMIDVIEHIPENCRQKLFQNINKISSSDVKLFLTYPSPGYQRYLIKNNPKELQIIDNIIELKTLIKETTSAGFEIVHYSLESIWRLHDYVHVILQKGEGDDMRKVSRKLTLTKKLLAKSKRITNLFIIPLKRRKYITNVFK